MKLLIISHTPHYYNTGQKVVGLAPTVLEINHLSATFYQIIHIGVLYRKEKAPAGFIPYANSNIHFVPIPPHGGKTFTAKLRILLLLPKILYIIIKALQKSDVYQFRAPTSIGVLVIPFLTIFSNKKGWYKYAGNWTQKKPPLSYAFQRWWLSRMQNRKVTINGTWPNLPVHCLPFENPCLEEKDIKKGKQIVQNKIYRLPLVLCFVGRIESAKGVKRILEAIAQHPHPEWFRTIHMIGNGPDSDTFNRQAETSPVPIIFHGTLDRKQVFQIYEQSHILLLPSDSEGFPKVIAEAANFGCIPVTSKISSINQYVTEAMGYLWEPGKESFPHFFRRIDFTNGNLAAKAEYSKNLARSFTFTHYIEHIKKEVL